MVYLLYIMEFEYDEVKSKRNKEKHGIDFVEAQLLWDDPERMEIPAKTEDETRYVVIGKMGEKHWSVIVTCRKNKTRIISHAPITQGGDRIL